MNKSEYVCNGCCGGSKKGPLGPNSITNMQFLSKIWSNNKLVQSSLGLGSFLGKTGFATGLENTIKLTYLSIVVFIENSSHTVYTKIHSFLVDALR